MDGASERKKRMKLALWGCLALMLFATGCAEQKPPDTRAADERVIRDLDAQWVKTAASRDVDATVAYYSDDASLLSPNAPIASDKQSIRAAWAALLAPDISLSWQANKVEVARSSDLAYIVGTYQMTSKDAHGKAAEDHGKFVEVWKKQADNNWKVVADIFNTDLPEARPAERKATKQAAHHSSKKKKKHHSQANGD